MFNGLRYRWSLARFSLDVKYLQSAVFSNDREMMKYHSARAVDSGRKTLELEKKFMVENIRVRVYPLLM
jgi:hypothetical protein